MIGSAVPRVALLLTTVAAIAAACGAPTSSGTASTATTTPSPSSSAATATTAPTSSRTAPTGTAAPADPIAAAASPSSWSTAPVTVVHHPPVPPVPVVTGVRYAAHPEDGYDRIVFDIPGALPGYSAKYVPKVVADGSGEPVPVPGSYYLLIVFTPAQAHRDDSTPTISGTHRINLPMIESYAVAGDYEGYVSVALGLNGKAGYHIAELANRVYIDVAA